MLASILRAEGYRALAKTTGSQAQYILPDGKAIRVPRRGMTSIIEQKKLVKKAAAENANYLIAEIMSLHPENHYVESQQILKPNLVVITNVRQDHIEAMGESEDNIASVLNLDIPPKAEVLILEKEQRQIFEETANKSGGRVIPIPSDISADLHRNSAQLQKEFPDILDLVYGVSKHLGINRDTILTGLIKAKYDIGKNKIWHYKLHCAGEECFMVNGFAANDPESTSYLIAKTRDELQASSGQFIGIINLRSDRGDRTLQWIQALQHNSSQFFNRLYIIGSHRDIVKRKLGWAVALKDKSPEKIMSKILPELNNGDILFGCGNIAGLGQGLIDLWDKIGTEHGI
jgi:poly-gamma-glutamate synthase PgsB/CapB